jgi:hypothetical protein
MTSSPADSLAREILEVVLRDQPLPIAHHSIRTFHFAELIAHDTVQVDDPEYDRGLLFAATMLHDAGLGSNAPRAQRFELEGADLAVRVLTQHGVGDVAAARVWDAIALHTSPGIAERRGPIARLTRLGVLADLGRYPDISEERAAAIHADYPRMGAVAAIVDAVVKARDSGVAVAPYTLQGELCRERDESGTTRLESSIPAGIWRE